ncbi:MAG: PLP-dependent cysteine synthase family protein [Thermoguttaceae bacterium]|nr:PLP-dependent cysteine synthase family protein [Thermoguttaceae bacterium]MBQ2039861.1 PLP-dependent cysteine synthase family protein [Thermoguttaceae bacterium]MBQ2555589.1 PLP-dependent cysteine synthase family protein [Thermoguttaceae bacterium]MBQ3822460.1 PLP-dependent cysteine synthase family protein [Thermoguttaceae bacterium]MBQ4081227.1 PLP-dependent cysteine synthase family protein [Thermoguttaceae bacterium]
MDPIKRLDGIESLVGSTPLLKIDLLWRGKPRSVFAKAEYLNLTGSIKDRMAMHILRKGFRTGELKRGSTIVEATSGNTGVSFSALGRLVGSPVVIYMPDWMSIERINLMKAYGAEVRLVSREQGGFKGSIELSEKMKKEDPENVFLPRQFDNEDNSEAHFLSTGPEIVIQLARQQRRPDAFIAGVGTGGTVMGCGKFLRKLFPDVKVHPLEPSSSPTLSTGYKIGFHRIQGISDEFIPAILKLNELDHVVNVDDGDAILAAQALSRNLGLGVGISAGGNFLGALKLLNEMPEEKAQEATVVTVFVDDNKKYLSTDYSKAEEPKEGFLAPEIELLQVSSVGLK